ncbi:MAG: DUF4115 domain-containing protein [Scytonema sp. PMC 1069.18]|nr:DUF4115 domain-containing protein [Scytonema sp. PMC 1069.18]MEC4882443.1 DUF4115 domain-containing protein [Scytonema sp. PMC 1070.18]
MKLSNQAQEEQLKEIVAHLRQVREQHSVRIEELAAYTRIRPTFLQALEEGRFEELPEPVYVQGFIRHYGDAIGLDGNALAKNVASICAPPEPNPNNDNQEVEKKPNLYIPLAVPYVLLLAAASVGLFYILNPQRSSESFAQKNVQPLSSKQKTASKPQTSSTAKSFPMPSSSSTLKATQPVTAPTQKTASVATTPTLTPSSTVEPGVPNTPPTPATSSLAETNPTLTESPTMAVQPVEVAIELQDQAWLRVKVDGKTEFEGILEKGDRKSWKAEKELEIRSGNAGAVLISANNKEPKPLGKMGSVEQITFTPEMVNGQ